MKPYLESIRRLSRVALMLLVLCVAASVIMAMQFCTTEYLSSIPSFQQMFLPVIIYAFAGGIILAMDAFSFLNKRSDSDYYHGLPVSRRRLFWAITLGAITWLAATILLSVISVLVVYTVSHTPFVPNYTLVAVPFCLAVSLLTFAAAAIAMSVTGTWMTGIAITTLVLGLPRFVQFVIARGIIARFGMLSWLDLPWYLSPVSNVATGQIVTFTRNLLGTQLYHIGNSLYSLLIAVVELVVACLLFVRRPSEIAERGAKNAKLQTLFACLVIFPIGILFASNAVDPTLTNLLIVVLVMIALFVIYQVVSLRNTQKAIRSLPWALIPAAVALGFYLLTPLALNATKYDIPNASEVAYIQFPGSNRISGEVSYDEYRVSLVKFTDENLKKYVLSTLQENVSTTDSYGNIGYSNGPYVTYEPVKIVLNNGRKISRELCFGNSNTLNSMREETPAYAEAVRSLPPLDSICYRQNFDAYDAKYAQSQSIQEAFYADEAESGLITNWQYKQRSDNDYGNINENQSFGSLSLTGYVGSQRYANYYNITLETQNAAAAWMRWQNNQSSNEYFDILKQISAQADAPFNNSTDYLNCTFSIYNVPMSDGTKQLSTYYYNRSATDETILNSSFSSLANELIDIISRSEPTDNPNDLCVFMSWSGRALDDKGAYIGADVIARQYASSGGALASGGQLFGSAGNVAYYTSSGYPIYYNMDGTVASYNPCYRVFSAQDQTRVIEILKEWTDLQKQLQFSYDGGYTPEVSIGTGGEMVVSITPTPAP